MLTIIIFIILFLLCAIFITFRKDDIKTKIVGCVIFVCFGWYIGYNIACKSLIPKYTVRSKTTHKITQINIDVIKNKLRYKIINNDSTIFVYQDKCKINYNTDSTYIEIQNIDLIDNFYNKFVLLRDSTKIIIHLQSNSPIKL